MAAIILHRSPFGEGATDYDQHSGSLIDWLQDHYPNGFGVPIAVTLNGMPLSLENLDIHLLDDDVVEITVQPAGAAVAGFALNAIIALAVSYVVSRVFGPKPPKNPAFAATPQPSPIYSVAVAQNATRLGEAIPVIYGEVMTTPDYASQPYLALTEVQVIDATAPPGYTIEFLDVSHATLSSTTTGWAQGWLFLTDGVVFAPWDTGSASPGLVEGVALVYDIYPTLSYWFSPSNDPLDAGAFELGPLGPPGTVIYRVTNNQTSGDIYIAREEGNNGDQYLCGLFCVGCGDFEAVTPSDIRIGNTTLDMLDASTFTTAAIGSALHGQTIGPLSFVMNLGIAAGVPTFWENCITALEVGDQELIKAGDETLFFPVGNRDTFRLYVDIAFPRGLYHIDATGAFQLIAVEILIEVQSLDDGIWQDFFTRTITFTNAYIADVSPFRRSLAMAVSPGMYRVKLKRITAAAPTDGSVSDAIQWIGLRGFIVAPLENNYAYGDCTMLPLRIRANNLISENATSRIQARVKRLIPGIGYTRSPAHCVRDIMENTDYGAQRPPGVDIDWPLFAALDARWAGGGGFSGGFTERVTIWEALSAVLTPGLAEPILVGGQISARYEGIRTTRVQVFTDANIVQNTLSIAYTFKRVGEPDGFTTEYRDLESWQPAYVSYPVDALNPEKVAVFGLTDIFNAFLYANFLQLRRDYTRKRIRFDVELEGAIPLPGDLIGVQQPMIFANAGGRVVAYNTTTRELQLEVPFDFPAGTKVIVLRDQYGLPSPSIVFSAVSPTVITLAADPPFPVADPYGDSPTLYAIGALNTTISDWLVDAVTHSGEFTFTIDASNYDARIYAGTFPFLLTEL